MKRILLALGALMTMGLCATAQTIIDEVDIETSDNVKLEVILLRSLSRKLKRKSRSERNACVN